MTRYASGRRQEWRVRKMLEAEEAKLRESRARVKGLLRGAGALFLVVRSAGSKGLADLVALFDHMTVAIQVKNHLPSQADHEEVCAASEKTDARWALVYLNGGEMQTWVYRRGKAMKVPVPGLR